MGRVGRLLYTAKTFEIGDGKVHMVSLMSIDIPYVSNVSHLTRYSMYSVCLCALCTHVPYAPTYPIVPYVLHTPI